MIESPSLGLAAALATAQPRRITRQAVAGWVLYDLVNSILSIVVI